MKIRYFAIFLLCLILTSCGFKELNDENKLRNDLRDEYLTKAPYYITCGTERFVTDNYTIEGQQIILSKYVPIYYPGDLGDIEYDVVILPVSNCKIEVHNKSK
jgi:hypothetical protein